MDPTDSPQSLSTLSDEQLSVIACQVFEGPQDARLEELINLEKVGKLSVEEQAEYRAID